MQKCSDNHEITIIASVKKSCDNRDNHNQQEAIIVFSEKLKTAFRINPIPSVHTIVWFGLSAFLTILVCYYHR